MAKQIKGGNGQVLDVEAEYVEFGVEYDLDGETFVTQSESEDDARLMRACLNGTLVVRTVYETAWAIPEDGA